MQQQHPIPKGRQGQQDPTLRMPQLRSPGLPQFHLLSLSLSIIFKLNPQCHFFFLSEL